jgi:hypothetical protein
MLPVDMAVSKDYLDIKGKFYVIGNPFVVVGYLTTVSVSKLHNVRLFGD